MPQRRHIESYSACNLTFDPDNRSVATGTEFGHWPVLDTGQLQALSSAMVSTLSLTGSLFELVLVLCFILLCHSLLSLDGLNFWTGSLGTKALCKNSWSRSAQISGGPPVPAEGELRSVFYFLGAKVIYTHRDLAHHDVKNMQSCITSLTITPLRLTVTSA